MYCTGNFVDDYAVDEVERNDRSFIFMVEIRAGRIGGLRLQATVIRDLQARLAKGEEAEEIGLKMSSVRS
jgi:hypothetical protein